jgi:hypothetical protein
METTQTQPTNYPEKLQATIQDSLATLQDSSSLSPIFSQQSTIELNAIELEKLTDELIRFHFAGVDSILSRHPDLLLVKNEQDHQTIITRIYWTLLKNMVQNYQQSEIILREHLQELIFGLYIFAVNRGVVFQPYQHTEVVLIMAQLDEQKAFKILKTLPESSWSEQTHAMAYHLEWRQGLLQ